MCVVKNERGRRKQKLGIWGVGVGHGRATTGTGRANLLEFLGLSGMVRHGPCQGSGILGSNFFFFSVFLNLARRITYKTNKNKQKAIKCVGYLPRSARLESLA